MNLLHIATRSLRHFWSTNLAIALGVAAATAVLTGALIVGDSMRSSLRDLTLQRLGKIDDILVSDGFFRSQLAEEIAQLDTFKDQYDQIAPAILFPGGTVALESETVPRYAGQVTVLGITDQFWNFDLDQSSASPELSGNNAIVNQALADDLGILAADVDNGSASITVRVPKQSQLPADSALGRKTDLIETLVDLKVIQIRPNVGLARFGLFPSQADPLNVFLPIGLLQNSLARSVLKHKADPNQANVLFLSGQGSSPPTADVSSALRKSIRPRLADIGLQLSTVLLSHGESNQSPKPIYSYTSLSSDKLLISDDATQSIAKAFPAAKPVFTYLANDIRSVGKPSGIPFSMVAGIDLDSKAKNPQLFQFQPASAVTGKTISQPTDDQIVLNQWAAEDLEIEIGDRVAVTFFEPESTHGSQDERSVEFTVADIAAITTPDSPFGYNRRDGVTPPTYSLAPTIANDPDLTPIVPGVTDAESIEDWDLPFATADKIRGQDDDYWDNFRTTPKAFINLAVAQNLFSSRFGNTTSFRVPTSAGSTAELEKKLSVQFADDEAKLGLNMVPIKRRGLAASSGSTPFDVLFLALSMFVIGSALILVSLLFRLSLQQRSAEVGLFKAAGFAPNRLRNVWLMEMLLVSVVGALIGIVLGIGYAALMIQGLTTWWVGAIERPFLTIHISWISLLAGLVSGLLACVATIAISLRRTRKQPVINLLRGELESSVAVAPTLDDHRTIYQRLGKILPFALATVAILLAVFATQLSGEPQAGAFMGAGFLLLAAGLMFVYRWLSTASTAESAPQLSLSRIALLSAKRNPLRSTLTIGLVAVASFLIAAVSAFRLAPSDAGTAGFDWVATSSQPLFENLQTAAGQSKALGEDHLLPPETTVFSFRYKSGEDASCNNLYQSTQPRVLGVPQSFVENDPSFAWAGNLAETENPWQLLGTSQPHTGTTADPIPVVLDKNTANYSLKIFALGAVKEVHYDSGESFHFKAVGMLENTVLQGSLLMSEQDFVAAFPSVAGYQYFLIDDGDANTDAATSNSVTVATLEDRLSDLGFDARSAPKLLANFMSVQNTYLSTFQTLGALGLLLGTFGLAAVQIRSVLERKQELGLLRAVGFELPKLSRMVMLENAWLLITGLVVGIGSALLTTVPHWLVGSASVPWLALAAIFGSIAIVGLLASWLASRNIARVPLLESLRG